MAAPPPSLSSSSDPELRKDIISNRWVIYSPARAKRPSDIKSKSPASYSNSNQQQECPFCIGHEHECAPEIFRVPPDVKSDWKIRVIQNLYPALSRDINPDPNAENEGCQVVKGFGFHDVVIESPTHPVHLSDLSPAEVAEVLLAYKKRILQIAANKAVKYIQVFKNHGATAGASMSHSHSQMIAFPVITPMIMSRLEAMKHYLNETRKCILCEAPPKELQINDSRHFISVVPFAATYPFEIWIIPRDHCSHFHEIDHDKAVDLGKLLKLMLMKLFVQLNNPPYNFMIHTSPLQMNESELPSSHWFLQIVPQLTVVGGSELGTGCYINPVFPEDAAKVLREAQVSDIVNIT